MESGIRKLRARARVHDSILGRLNHPTDEQTPTGDPQQMHTQLARSTLLRRDFQSSLWCKLIPRLSEEIGDACHGRCRVRPGGM